MEELNDFKHELQNIINGDDHPGQSNLIKATQTYLKSGHRTGEQAKAKFSTRAEEERALIEFANEHAIWVKEEVFGNFITEGAEQRVYYHSPNDFVLKKADAIFYSSWLDYFNNLLLHNAFFPNTAYELLGFMVDHERIFSIVKQQFIISNEQTNLSNVKLFLEANGFKQKKNNDYFHPELGIILEDLHDENVLTNDGVLFFVDTVFYLTPSFYSGR